MTAVRRTLYRVAVIALSAAIVLPGLAGAQKTETADVTRCDDLGELSRPEARQRAIDNARAEAVRQVAGVRLQGEQTQTTDAAGADVQKRYRNVVQVSTEGRVLSETLLEDRLVVEDLPDGRGQRTCYRIRMRAKVALDEGAPDPNFNLDVTLVPSRAVLYDRGPAGGSDEIVISAKSTIDAYLTIFYISQDTGEVLLPNDVMPERHMKANVAFEFPSAEWRRQSAHLVVELGKGQSRHMETLICVATRDPVVFPGSARTREAGALPLIPVTVSALQTWLSRIKLHDRAEAILTYEVRSPPSE